MTEVDLVGGRKVVGSFVEKVRLEVAARQVCLSMVGRTIEAISTATMKCLES